MTAKGWPVALICPSGSHTGHPSGRLKQLTSTKSINPDAGNAIEIALRLRLDIGGGMGAVVNAKLLGFTLAAISFALVGGCVNKADLDSWQGVPVVELDKHPFFLTVPMVRTMASDGTEIRNYVNGQAVASCSGGGQIFGATVDMARYSGFTSCMQNFRACNNIFYIKNSRVEQYITSGTGGAICTTDDKLRPGFRGSINY